MRLSFPAWRKIEEQIILAEGKTGKINYRETSGETVRYSAAVPDPDWFMGLISPEERMISPLLHVIAGNSRLMEIDAALEGYASFSCEE